MEKRMYHVMGQVINLQNKKGIFGLRVELWDKDTKCHDLLGERLTDSEGRFERIFDETFFCDFAPDRMPDLFFRVYQGEMLIKSTEDSVMWNVKEGETNVVIAIDMPVEKQVPADRLTTVQVMKGVEFFQKSDFQGVIKEASCKIGIASTLVADMIKESFSQWDLSPVQPPEYRCNSVIGQNTRTAQDNLAGRKIMVTEIQSYQPELIKQSFQTVTALTGNLNAGDKVILYEKEGRVQSYALVKEKEPTDINAADVVRLDQTVTGLLASKTELSTDISQVKNLSEQNTTQLMQEINATQAQNETMKVELASLRAEVAQKDLAIVAVKQELASVQSAQNALTARIQPDLIEKMQADIRSLLDKKKKTIAEK